MTLTIHILALLILAFQATAQGTQFITGPCASDTDCASACCGFNSGKCAGPVVAQERDGGCGFGNAQPNNNAAKAISGGASSNTQVEQVDPVQPTSTIPQVPLSISTASAEGTQFITGPCTKDADCASACCGFRTGKCAGPVVAQERDGGCGFGNAQPNNPAPQKRHVVW